MKTIAWENTTVKYNVLWKHIDTAKELKDNKETKHLAAEILSLPHN